MSNPGELLLISDIEGCAKVDYFDGSKPTVDEKTPQNTDMCTEDFFEKLKVFLESNIKKK